MRTVGDTIEVELEYTKEELIFDKYIPVLVVSDKLRDKEEKDKLGYKALRNRLYNSLSCKKFNTETFASLKYIDVKNPMNSKASINLNFKEVQ